jgi:uncharacterized membrane protein
MSGLPTNMELVDDQPKLELGAGLSEINYIFSSINPTNNLPISNDSSFSYTTVIGGLIIAAITGVVIILKRKQSKSSALTTHTEPIPAKQSETTSVDTETIFSFRPEMREDDKEIIKFISDNGGQALESELRKKFLQPRTTMWRAVKRLERLGVIEIDKKDLQNLVKLKKDLEEEK